MENAIALISSSVIRSPSRRGTSAPSTRNSGGSPIFRWMSDAPPLIATVRISLSSIGPHFRWLYDLSEFPTSAAGCLCRIAGFPPDLQRFPEPLPPGLFFAFPASIDRQAPRRLRPARPWGSTFFFDHSRPVLEVSDPATRTQFLRLLLRGLPNPSSAPVSPQASRSNPPQATPSTTVQSCLPESEPIFPLLASGRLSEQCPMNIQTRPKPRRLGHQPRL